VARASHQGLLPFDFDPNDATDEVTGRAGLPLLLETMLALRVGQAVKQHVKLRKRNAGFSEAEMMDATIIESHKKQALPHCKGP
jgi:hypothetical protein